MILLKFNNFVILLNQLTLVKQKLQDKQDSAVENFGRQLSLLLYKNFNKVNDDLNTKNHKPMKTRKLSLSGLPINIALLNL